MAKRYGRLPFGQGLSETIAHLAEYNYNSFDGIKHVPKIITASPFADFKNTINYKSRVKKIIVVILILHFLGFN